MKDAPVRLGLSLQEAADALGVSQDYFVEHVLPEIRIVRRGRRRIVPLAELQRWLDTAAVRTLEVA
jgi:excisionase family DNA binding protein